MRISTVSRLDEGGDFCYRHDLSFRPGNGVKRTSIKGGLFTAACEFRRHGFSQGRTGGRPELLFPELTSQGNKQYSQLK